MKNLDYSELKTQDYFFDKNLSITQKRMIFKYRTHLESFKVNYKYNFTDLRCELCKAHPDSQIDSILCNVIFGQDQESRKDNLEMYLKIYDEKIPKETTDLIWKIAKTRDLNC